VTSAKFYQFITFVSNNDITSSLLYFYFYIIFNTYHYYYKCDLFYWYSFKNFL